MFTLDLSSWETDVPEVVKKPDPTTGDEVNVFSGETIKENYPVRENLQAMLRSPGVFEDINDVAEAVHLAHVIKDEKADEVSLDQRQVTLLKKCLDTHLKAAANQRGNFGGPQHELLILRIAGLTKQAKVK